MLDVRHAIASQIRQLVGSGENAAAIEAARTDTGFFGPGSASWKVHGDFTSMMIGGVTALLLQMLHPGALAGVWDHSNFREDMQGRLKRTARFIAGTTYGSREEAERLIAHVAHIHDQVSGTVDGRPYSANDPDLLTWIHVAEVSSFLAAYLRYRNPTFSPADQDRYYREYALVARKLGAVDVPESRAAIAAYLRQVRPQLRHDDRTREVCEALLNPPVKATTAPVARLIFEAAEDLLPEWAQQMHGFHVPLARRPAIRLGVRGMGGVFRWALTNSAEARARRKAAELGAA